MRHGWHIVGLICVMVGVARSATAEDWSRFRGPNGSGVSADRDIPTEWSATKNIVWQADLPGPGSSSPIISGPHVFLTSYSGYAVDRSNPGDIAKLERHLLCFDRKTGTEVWKQTVAAKQPEDRFNGFMIEHGYASSTPVTDGERVYAFFGKSGVFAFDLAGKQLWQVDVGSGSGMNGWGSGSSLILHGDVLIVNADAESECVLGLNKLSGSQVWKASAKGYKGSWATPVLLTVGEQTELIVAVPGELWGLDPTNGGLLWFCEAGSSRAANASVVTKDGVAYLITGGPGGSTAVAVRGGGRDDVAKTHLVWKKNVGSYVPSPVLHGAQLVWVDDRGQLQGVDAKTGESLYRERLPDAGGVYASITAVDDKLMAVTRRKGTFVMQAGVMQVGEKPTQLAINVLAGDDSDFNASPAIQDGRLFLRSNRKLYCIGVK